MRCGTPIMARTFLPTKDENTKVIGMKKLASYRQVDRRGRASILCCQQCEPLLRNITPEEEDRIESVQMHGWISGMVFAGKSDEHIKGFIKMMREA